MFESIPKREIEGVVAVINPQATHARRIRRSLKALPYHVEEALTSRDIRRTQDEIYKKARPGFVLLGAGGDGTAHQIGNILLHPETAERGLRSLPFVPLRGGNANDIARSLNGRSSIINILRHAKEVLVRPIHVQVAYDGVCQDERFALGYFSIGAAAEAAYQLEGIKDRNFFLHLGPQQIREVGATLRAVATYPPLCHVNEGGRVLHGVRDITFARGGKMAKYGRTHADLLQDTYEKVVSTVDGYWETARHMGKFAIGRLQGELLTEKTTIKIGHNPTNPMPPLPLEYDGDVFFDEHRAEAYYGGTVSVGLADKPLTMLSVRAA